ncbi:MAG: amidohydrolase family protein [Clostridia bacterium]|nr:amidohydrolase family protein [Clostridia bacterium]
MIDAHAHLWLKQRGMVNGMPVYDIGGGKSMFGDRVMQMIPPYMTDGVNSAERFLANMDLARVSAAVLTQEYIDGNQDEYLKTVRKEWPDRFRVTCLYEEDRQPDTDGADGIKICGGRLAEQDLTKHADVFRLAAEKDMFIAIDMADGDTQTGSLREMVRAFPDLRIAIGHFGMVTRPGWQEQIRLAREKNVSIESGGITWLYNSEFWPYPSAVRAILEARDICGMDKLMWGSDYPRTMTAITYGMSSSFAARSELLTDEEKELFFLKNARTFYRFGPQPEMPVIHHMAE